MYFKKAVKNGNKTAIRYCELPEARLEKEWAVNMTGQGQPVYQTK